MSFSEVIVIGAGLAGCEAALWLADKGVKVRLCEQKPTHYTPAHTMEGFAELVCSNSLKAQRLASAGGLLKAEMRLLGSALLQVAERCKVPAGGALAVDRDDFSRMATQLVCEHPNITIEHRRVQSLRADVPTIVASGPLTDGELAQEIQRLSGQEQLSFYDAAAPIVLRESLNFERIFAASRYDRGDDDYLNCPFDKEGYEEFWRQLVTAQPAPQHTADDDTPKKVYEGCMPIEIMAKRGDQTLRFGPLKPVGLRDPRTGHRPWACVQLRREDAEGRMYNLVGFQTNLRFEEQKRVFGMIPGLENAEFVRYGVMHRNTFLNSPKVLAGDFSLKNERSVFFAGQITGTEGYMESAACGLLAARAVYARLLGKEFCAPPQDTMCGALCAYLASENKDFQPMGANMGILPPLSEHIKGKQERYEALSARALESMKEWIKI